MFLTLGRQRYGQTRSIFAQALNDTAYTNNPKFLTVVNEYGFHAIPDFSKQSIADRAEIYLRMASDIWNPDAIKEIAGGWANDDEKNFFKNEKGREFTVGYAERSWPDALKYGFLSANLGGSGKSIYNVQVGDTVYCHIAGHGFVGIGECTSTAVPIKNFKVMVDLSNTQRPKKESCITLDVEMEDYYRIKNEGKNSTT